MKTKPKYPTEALLHSRAFSGYQQDFARAILAETEYTIEQAKAVLDGFFGKDVK